MRLRKYDVYFPFCWIAGGNQNEFLSCRVFWMGGERRFAPLLRIGRPGAIPPTFGLLRVILPYCAIRASAYAYNLAIK